MRCMLKKKGFRSLLVFWGVFVLLSAVVVSAENVTLTTYYPAPSGAYKNMRSHGLCVGTACTHAAISDNNLSVQGRIGIGTTVPGYALQVGTGVSTHGMPATGVLINGDLEVSGNFYGSGANSTGLAGGTINQVQYNGVGNILAGANNFVFNVNTGYVGIGTAAPQSRLDVRGDVHVGGAIQSSFSDPDIGGQVVIANPFKTTAGRASVWRIYNMTGATYGNSLQFWAYDNIGCAPGGLCASRFALADNGNVGIGSAKPSATLDVNGPVKIAGASAACGATDAGLMRYNTTDKIIEYCDGSGIWKQAMASCQWYELPQVDCSSGNCYGAVSLPVAKQNGYTGACYFVKEDTGNIVGGVLMGDDSAAWRGLTENDTFLGCVRPNWVSTFSRSLDASHRAYYYGCK